MLHEARETNLEPTQQLSLASAAARLLGGRLLCRRLLSNRCSTAGAGPLARRLCGQRCSCLLSTASLCRGGVLAGGKVESAGVALAACTGAGAADVGPPDMQRGRRDASLGCAGRRQLAW